MNENERPASNAGEKRSDRRPGGKFDGQRRPYAGKPEGHRPARPQGENARKDEKRPYDGKTASGPRKFDGERRPQPSGNRSFEKKTDRPCGKPGLRKAFLRQTLRQTGLRQPAPEACRARSSPAPASWR